MDGVLAITLTNLQKPNATLLEKPSYLVQDVEPPTVGQPGWATILCVIAELSRVFAEATRSQGTYSVDIYLEGGGHVIQKQRCERYIGKMIRFRTPYGVHKGIVERVTDKELILLSPPSAIPAQLAHTVLDRQVAAKDIQLAYGGSGYPGGHWGGYGAWGFGWSRWAVAFLIIYVLWGLWLW